MAASRGKTRKIEKDAWDWAENVDCDAITNEHLEKAYRINLPSCDKSNHKTNCKSNPNCLTGLGEKWWMRELKDEIWYEWEDPEKEKRSEGSFVGLKNLGATCYVNTFLQVWFHNVEFRSALYSWIPLDEPSMSQAPSQNNMELDVPFLNTLQGKVEKSKEGCVALSKAHDETSLTTKMSPASTYNVIQKIITEPCDFESKSEDCRENTDDSNGKSDSMNITNSFPPVPACQPWDGNEVPTSFCHHLQLLFAQLQYTSRRFIDPAPFVESLGLDKEQQQDAQEFCKLFMSLLEETLSQQPDPTLRNIVQQQFGGAYVYITRCRNCGNQSQRRSKFYELDLNIHGHGSLAQCIKEFLKKEDLQGDNQYYCSHCMGKQDATRYIKLQELPPVLNLQLLRFVFDRKTGYKKKLNNNIYFPEVLNMKDYVDSNLEGCVYDLTAVLIHRGPSAYSGHYIAHIKDKKSGAWYRFNDETIEKMKGKTLSLGSEEDLHESVNGCNASKKMKLSKGSQSKDAYMLVYSQRGDEKEAVAQEPPPKIQELVAKDNSKLDEWIREIQEVREKMALRGRERQNEIKKVCEVMSAQRGDEYEWISAEWLRKWFAYDRKQFIPIDNSFLLCPHGRLLPDKVVSAKRISVKAADFLFKRYGGFPRLKSDSFCIKCVRKRCQHLRFSSRLSEDQRFVDKALKTSYEGTGFWVSKYSLRRWKTLAQKAHGHFNPKSSSQVEEGNSPGDAIDDVTKSTGRNSIDRAEAGPRGSESGSLDADEKKLKFNEDLTCEHGCLSTSTTSRRLVSNEVWKRLRFYFPDAPEFPWRRSSCKTCLEHDKQKAERIEDLRQLAGQQKALLGQLYSEKERPDFGNTSSLTCYALSRTFYDDWRRFLRSPARCPRPSSISNETLICPHGGFLYQPQCDDNDAASSSLIYLWSMEWTTLSQVFGFDFEIRIVKEVFEEKINFFITPDCCVKCNAALVSEHFSEAEVYERAKIYVRKITDQHTKEEVQAILESYTTPESGWEDCGETQFVAGNTPRAPDEQRRRSSRHRKQRGEVVLTVNSSDTVRDVKVQLMKHFSVMPLDQHLSINGKVLRDDNSIVGSVGVRPGSILLLKVDEPQEGIAQEELARASRKPEEGFKGTSLVKHTPMTI